ncbi:hypothetical protein J1605_003513 [Eschrichtius robustus]|uniref:Uncharacterized protein n=1 Tax=Eschrichtius robustus TaxID=9764 RepID=A0AB34HRF7_ESCRO|nr:hypothetical protein J1605_003513 [Eschrichtius robustus]
MRLARLLRALGAEQKQGARVPSLVRELRSHMPRSVVEKQKNANASDTCDLNQAEGRCLGGDKTEAGAGALD